VAESVRQEAIRPAPAANFVKLRMTHAAVGDLYHNLTLLERTAFDFDKPQWPV
jgi:hypothetical protein